MRSLRLLATLIVITSSFGYAQRLDSIFWCDQRPLAWKDFVISSSVIGAETTSVIARTWVETPSGFVIKVKAVFLHWKSSCNPTDTTKELLNHEARHFDIAEIITRRARQYFAGKTFTPSTFKLTNDKLREMKSDLENMNTLYDSQSGSSQNRQGQERWNKYIASQLRALEQYAVDCKQSSL